jgi:hypothetical protein
LIFLSIFLCWPAMMNGGPFLFADTPSYITGADTAMLRMTGAASKWTPVNPYAGEETPTIAGTTDHLKSEKQMAGQSKSQLVIAGRSIYYGIVLYTGVLAGTLLLPIWLQALAASAVLLGAIRHFFDPADKRKFAVATFATFAFATVTPLPYFVCFLMPDIMTGLAAIGIAIIVTGWHRETVAGKVLWAALVAGAALVHASHIILLMAIGLLALAAVPPLKRRLLFAPVLCLFAAAGIGLGGEALFSHVTERVTGAPPVRPPFLAARLIADGPGQAYLDQHCPGSGFRLCDFARNPVVNSDHFLWGPDGVYTASSPEIRRELSAEQMRFVIAVVQVYPYATVNALIWNAFTQLRLFSLSEFNLFSSEREQIKARLPQAEAQWLPRTAAYQQKMPVRMTEILTGPLTAMALLCWAIAWRLPPFAQWRAAFGVAAMAVAINAVVCGCLSTPHDRYGARIIWVLAILGWLFVWRCVVSAAAFQGRQPGLTISPAPLEESGSIP